MSISASLSTSGYDLTDGTSHSIPGVTATAGKCYAVCVIVWREDSVQPAAPTGLSGLGLTWTARTTNPHDNAGGTRARLEVYTTGPVASTTSGALTLSHPASVSGIGWGVIEVSECNGFVQDGVTKGLSGSGDPSTLTLSAFAATANLALGVYATKSTDTFTPGSGFTNVGSAVWNTGSGSDFKMFYESKANDNTIDFGGNPTDVWGISGLECKDYLRVVPAGTITPTGSLGKRLATAFAGSITPTGALATVIARTISLAGSITPTGALSTLATFVRSFGGSITPTGSLSTSRIHHHLAVLASTVLNLLGLSGAALTLTPKTEDTQTLQSLSEAALALTAESDDSLSLTVLDEEDA